MANDELCISSVGPCVSFVMTERLIMDEQIPPHTG